MKSQQIVELGIHILFMLLITIGVISLLINISQSLNSQTMYKKANLVLNKVSYNIISTCYYSHKYNTTIISFVNLPKTINGYQYTISGNGTTIFLSLKDVSLNRTINASGLFYSGKLMKITCKNVAKISN